MRGILEIRAGEINQNASQDVQVMNCSQTRYFTMDVSWFWPLVLINSIEYVGANARIVGEFKITESTYLPEIAGLWFLSMELVGTELTRQCL